MENFETQQHWKNWLQASIDSRSELILLLDNNFTIECLNQSASSFRHWEMTAGDQFFVILEKSLGDQQDLAEAIQNMTSRHNFSLDISAKRVLTGDIEKVQNGYMVTASVKSTGEDEVSHGEMFHNILRRLPCSIYWEDKDGVVLGCSDYMAQLSGFNEADDIIGKSIYELAWRDFADELRINDMKVMSSGKEITLEETVRIKGGGLRTFLSTKAPLKDERGEIVGTFGVSMDITNRKRQEEATKLSEQEALNQAKTSQLYLENIIQSMPGHVYWKDRDGVLLGCNQQMAESAGYSSPKDLIGKTDYELSWKHEAENIRVSDKQVMETGLPQSFQEEGTIFDASRKVVLSNKLPLQDKQGNILGIVGISTDITELKETQDQLAMAKEKAEVANQAKTDFLANMSHDLRTPLNGIIGIAQILGYSDLPKDAKEKIHDLMQASKSLLALVDDVLNYSKLDAGKLEFKQEPFDLRKLMEEVVNSLTYLANDKQIPLILNYNEQLPKYVVGDSLRIRQVLTNLIGNAIKFTEKGHVLISVECRDQVEGVATMQFSVEDTGAGIPEEKLEYIFDRFSQVSPSYKARQQGTGLGLAIVKKFVEGMHGKVGLHSQVNKGSMFWFSVPLTCQENVTHDNVWAEEYGALRVLIVDDNVFRGEILLKQIPGEPGSFCSSEMAIEVAKSASQHSKPYHIVIVDSSVETLSAELLAQQIRGVEDYRPMLVLLGDSSETQKDAEQLFFLSLRRSQQSKFLEQLRQAWDKWSSQVENPQQDRKIIRILLVEDNQLNQKVAVTMLKKLCECDVVVASDGRSAIESFDHTFDIVLMDIGLPDMDGFDVSGELNKLGCKAPIVAMTAHADLFASEKAKVKQKQIVSMVPKPVMMKQLKEVLDEFVVNEN